MEENQPTVIKPQPGPQERFLASQADIAIFGGGAGGGKTFGLLVEPLRHTDNKDFGGVIFRRTSPQIRNEGGLWDESAKLYPLFGATPKESITSWIFPSSSKIKFQHLEYDKTIYDHQGAQYPFIGFDELTHFTEKQFFYLLSRNRSTCGVRPYVRATCNPDPDSWVASFISWWINQDTGTAIPERSGVIRWFIRLDDKFLWGDSKQELSDLYGEDKKPKSVTFIHASVYDNKILLEKDPGYIANLQALPSVERGRLLDCNWKIRPTAGMYIRKEWFNIIEKAPDGLDWHRFWDLAVSVKTSADFTASVAVAIDENKNIYLKDMIHGKWKWPDTHRLIIKACEEEPDMIIGIEKAGQQGGFIDELYEDDELMDIVIEAIVPDKDKLTRALPWIKRAEAGKVYLVNGAWVYPFLQEGYEFTGEGDTHDDQIDAVSGGYRMATDYSPAGVF